MPYDINNVILTFAFAIDIALAAYLAVKDRKSATNISFSAVILSLAVWTISYVLGASTADPIWERFWINMSFFATSIMPACFLYFSIVFPKKEYIRLRIVQFSIFFPALIFGILSFTDLISTGISPAYVEPQHGPWYPLFAFYLIAYLFYSFYIIISKYVKMSGREKLQMQYLMLGTLITAVIGIFFNIFLVSNGAVSFGPIMVNTIGPACTLVLAGFVTYAIVRLKLLDIDDFMTRGTFLITLAFLLVGTATIIANGNSRFLIPFYVIVVSVSLGFFVLFQNMRSEVNRTFFGMAVCLGLWMYATFNLVYAASTALTVLWDKLVFIGPVIIPPLFLYFTNVFPKKTREFSRAQKITIFLPVIIILLMLSTDLMLKLFTASEIFMIIFGYPFFAMYFIVYLGFGLVNILNKYNASVGMEKMQLRYLFLGLFASSVLGGITNLLLPWAGETRYVGYGLLFTILFISSTAYAMGIRRLLSIEFMVQKGSIYLIIAAIFTLLYSAGGLILGGSFGDVFSYRLLLMVMFFSLLGALTFRTVYKTLQLSTDRLFFGGRYDYQNTILGMSQGITSVIKLNELIDLIVSTFLKTIKVDEISFLLYDSGRQRFRSAPCDVDTGGKYKRIDFDVRGPIAAWLSKYKDVLVRDEVEGEIDRSYFSKEDEARLTELKRLRDELERLGMAVWVPVISKEKLTAIIALGYKMSGDMYTDEDVGLLKTLANQVAVSIENSVMYSTITKQYEELKQTKDKLVEADKLASLGSMAAGMAHEIKNPLSSMKVFSQLLQERYEDPEFRRKFTEIIPKEINRIDRIVEGLINFARSPEPQISQVVINELVDDVLNDFKDDIERSGIKLEKNYGSSVKLLIDRDQMARALSNVILNAIQSMPSGGTLGLTVNQTDKPKKALSIKISDTGVGMTAENLKHIFEPFFTTKHYGTGLGLSITHSIIEGHKGTIEIESREGKGTTVSIALPLS